MLTAFNTTKGLRSFRKQQQACTLVARFFFRALPLPLPRSLPSFALAPPATKEEKESFLPTLLFRAICSLRTVSTFIYDKIYDYAYMNSRKYELVHTLFVFSFLIWFFLFCSWFSFSFSFSFFPPIFVICKV